MSASSVRELTDRSSRRGANVASLDSGAGLANATIAQRLVLCGCSTTTSWKRACASPISLAGRFSRPADAVADISVGWCPVDEAALDPQRAAVGGHPDRRRPRNRFATV